MTTFRTRSGPLAALFVAAIFLTSAAGPVVAALTDGVISHWKFDETSGTTASDVSGNSHPATLNNFDFQAVPIGPLAARSAVRCSTTA